MKCSFPAYKSLILNVFCLHMKSELTLLLVTLDRSKSVEELQAFSTMYLFVTYELHESILPTELSDMHLDRWRVYMSCSRSKRLVHKTRNDSSHCFPDSEVQMLSPSYNAYVFTTLPNNKTFVRKGTFTRFSRGTHNFCFYIQSID